MALRAGYYGVKRFLRNKLETIVRTYDETIESLFPRSEQAVLGAKNLLPKAPRNYNYAGVIVVINKDNSITINGTCTAAFQIPIITKSKILPKSLLNIYYDNSEHTDMGVDLYGVCYNGDTSIGQKFSLRIGKRTFNNDYDGYDNVSIGLWITTRTYDNVTFYPMITMGTDDDDTYVPHAMTNKELTDSASDQKTAINAIITAATDAADFAAFKTAMGAITPVTRSLSLAKEDITEEVKEDVEPDKTVTKKRTTKKTEEV